MADDESVGTLEEESLKRKERLKALKRKHEQPDDSEDGSKNENSTPVNLPKPKFRSYRPQDENLKQQIIEDAKPGDVESQITSHLEAANSKVVIEDLDISSLAPRKPDWDLKRDLAKKLEMLERRTHKAIAELIRERLKNEAKEMDLATSVADYQSGYSDAPADEMPGEEYGPRYICMKREVPEEEICESESSSCPDARTTTGNILDRMITDPLCRRPPCLGKWPTWPPKSESDLQENIHQHKAALQQTTLGQMCSLRVTSEPNIFRQPAIVGTLGPASADVNSIGELLEAGVNIIRLSMSHIDPCFKLDRFQNVIEASNQYKTMRDYEVPIAVMMALKGPEIRTGKLDPSRVNKSKELYLKQGAIVRLTNDKIFEEKCTEKMVYVDYAGLQDQATPGTTIYISDGEIKLKVDQVESTTLVCIIETAGNLRQNQRVHIPDLPLLLPAVSDYDVECLELAVKMEVDIIAVPNTRNEEAIERVRKTLRQFQPDNNILILGTISSFEGLENIDCVLSVVDGIIIQRNDLSVDVSPEKMFIAQKEIIAKCNRLGKPVLCTAQLSSLESSNKISQRMEMNDIAGAIVDGADGIILIRETALGDQGVLAVSQLSAIMREAEAVTMQKPFYFDLVDEQIPSIEPSKAIALAAVQIANKIQASAILTVTTSGRTAQMLSWFRPRPPVIAISRVGKTARQMNLWRAVIPLHFTAPVHPDWFQDVKSRFEYGIAYGRSCGIIQSGDLLVLVSGFRKKSGFTNSIRVVFASLELGGFVDNVSQYYNLPGETY